MNRSVAKRPLAEIDLIGYYAYLCEYAGTATAVRFLAAVEKTLELVARSPGIGGPCEIDNRRLIGLRSIAVSKFKHYLLFYHAFEDRIELVRVLHSARDIQGILEAECDDEG